MDTSTTILSQLSYIYQASINLWGDVLKSALGLVSIQIGYLIMPPNDAFDGDEFSNNLFSDLGKFRCNILIAIV